MIIRLAVAEDTVKIMQLLKKTYDESSINYPKFIDCQAVIWIAGVISQNLTFVAESDGEIVGSIGFVPAVYPWNSQEYYMNDSWFFVESSYRNGGTASKLIEAAKNKAIECKATMRSGVMTGTEAEKKDRFCAMRGLKYAGGQFVFNDGVK